MIIASIILHLKKYAKFYIAAILIAALVWFGKFLYDSGKLAATADFLNQQVQELTDKNEQLRIAQAEILRLQGERDTAVADLAKKERAIDQVAQEQINEIQESHETVVERLRTTIDGMSVDLRMREADAATSKLASSVIASYARGQARLSEEAVRFFVTEADRGDQCAVTLNACQELHQLRETAVNEYNKKYFGADVKF